MGKFEQLVEDHDSYNVSYRDAEEWLQFAVDRLADASDGTGERDQLENKLDTVKVGRKCIYL